MNAILIAALLLTAGVALLPEASANCMPLLDQYFCGSPWVHLKNCEIDSQGGIRCEPGFPVGP